MKHCILTHPHLLFSVGINGPATAIAPTSSSSPRECWVPPPPPWHGWVAWSDNFRWSKKPQKSCLSNATCHSSPLPNGANSLSQGPKVLKKKSQTVHDFPGALKALEGQNGGLLLNHHFGDHPVASWAKILRGTPGDSLWHDVGMGQSWVIGPKRKQKELVN